jgi:hypothetical protein
LRSAAEAIGAASAHLVRIVVGEHERMPGELDRCVMVARNRFEDLDGTVDVGEPPVSGVEQHAVQFVHGAEVTVGACASTP